MAIQTQKVEPHWSYLLSVEHDFEELSRFVAFDERNFYASGIEIARLLLTCGAETDVVCKQACTKVDAASKAASIDAYRNELVRPYPGIPNRESRPFEIDRQFEPTRRLARERQHESADCALIVAPDRRVGPGKVVVGSVIGSS
jgi:hypothetical protein